MAVINGNDGNNNIVGTSNNDTLSGGSGNDTLTGGEGNDSLVGGIGKDRLFGNSGADILIGDSFDDTLVGGSGNDTLRGGAGKDLYIINSPDDGIDVIQDFSPGKGDRIQISAANFGIELNNAGVPLINEFTFSSFSAYYGGVLYFGDAQLALLYSDFNGGGNFAAFNNYITFV
ncbi:MAG: calcium-binding protein [Nostoc sp. DedQUE12b]|uniref:calcium-binding protein n=1 Tax=Nostoc sp. DedQUE12b TaxID=3075398 RepID=UPI002AD4D0FB|nr:calcium-binding protein [Nostoc sp. DedQUE12b]MDZ8088650.1 calcium-binding protein [Nostoc sp. DedQUE12b]